MSYKVKSTIMSLVIGILLMAAYGLYAAGNDAASIMGGEYTGAGITLGPGLTFVISGIMAVNFPLFVGMIELLITTGS